jgi:hypothetical protein
MKLLIVGSLFLSSMAFAANGEMVSFSNNQACFIGGSSQALECGRFTGVDVAKA